MKRSNFISGPAFLLGAFISASAAIAQEGDVRTSPGRTDEISALAQDVSSNAFSGGTMGLRVCTTDGLGQETCDVAPIILPCPPLNNALGCQIQLLRRDLALAVENAMLDESGVPLAESVFQNVTGATANFQWMYENYASSFQNHETLIRLMDMHFELIEMQEAPSLDFLIKTIDELRAITLQLEDDIESVSDILLRESPDLHKALSEVLEELGMSLDEFNELFADMQSPEGSEGGDLSMQLDMPLPSYEDLLEMIKDIIEFLQKMQKYIKDLNEILELQQALRDEAFELTMRLQDGLDPADRASLEDFETRQQELIERLAPIIEGMDIDGLPTFDLGQALDEMIQAEENLDLVRPGEALEDIEQALEALILAIRGVEQAASNMSGVMPGGDGGTPLPPDTGAIFDEGYDPNGIQNLNRGLGIDTGENNAARDIRDRFLERQQQDGTTSPYVDRLLEQGGP